MVRGGGGTRGEPGTRKAAQLTQPSRDCRLAMRAQRSIALFPRSEERSSQGGLKQGFQHNSVVLCKISPDHAYLRKI